MNLALMQKQLTALQGENHPLQPDDFFISLGTELADWLKKLLSQNSPSICVAVSYHSSDVVTHIQKLAAFPDHLIATINIQTLEFFADVLHYANHPDYEHARHLIAKYMARAETTALRPEYAALYREIYERDQAHLATDYRAYVRQMILCGLFLGLHEQAHLMPDLLIPMLNLLHSEESQSYTGALPENIITESACDYIAAHLLSNFDAFQQFAGEDGGTFESVLGIALCLVPMYSALIASLSQLIPDVLAHSAADQALQRYGAYISERITCTLCAVKQGINSRFLPQSFDLNQALSRVAVCSSVFASHVAQFLTDDLMKEVELYNQRNPDVPSVPEITPWLILR